MFSLVYALNVLLWIQEQFDSVMHLWIGFAETQTIRE
jgi:hypothetical protein